MKPGTSRLLKTAGTILALYIIIGLLFFLFQEKLLFHPKALRNDHKFTFSLPFQEIRIDTNGHRISIVKFPVASQKKGTVLFYHGNMKNMEHYAPYSTFFTSRNYEVWMIDYPGFGKTTGKLSEELIYADALLMYDMVQETRQTNNLPIIYGKSIGTGVASYVASRRASQKLVLETPYYSMNRLAKHYLPIYPVNLLLKYRLPTADYLKLVTSPITVLHGTDDEIIPYCHAKDLEKEIGKLELVTIREGQHNNLSTFSLFQKKLDSLLN